MRFPTVTLAGLLLGLSCASCAPTPEREFTVEAINTREEAVPCIIFRDGDLVVDDGGQPVLTPAPLAVRFSPDGSGSLRLRVRAVETDGEGHILRGLHDAAESPYLEDERHVRRGDAAKQLFILGRNRNFGG